MSCMILDFLLYCCSVAKLCLTLCNPMDCSTPGLSIPHQLPKFAQVHVHCIGDAIQQSHPLTPSSPSALNLFQHRGLFQCTLHDMQSTSCKMQGWMNHKLELRLPREISTTSDMQMIPLSWKKAKRN